MSATRPYARRILQWRPLLAALVVCCGPAGAQSSEELKAEIEALKQGQAAILKELAEIRKLLQGRQPGQPEPFRPVSVNLSGSHPLGRPEAKVTLVEFTDYQCPFCRRHAQQVLPRLIADYVDPGKVRYFVREFPLTQIHPRATQAAQAALCAGEQNQYWAMHRRIFADQSKLADEDFIGYAEEIGLDMDAFRSCLQEGKYQKKIERDMADGASAGVQGTPSFLLGLTDPKNPDQFKATEFLQGALPLAKFKEVIDKLLGQQVEAADGAAR